MPEHGDSLRAHAEGKSTELRWVVPSILQDFGMDHPAAQDLQPPSIFTNRASYPAADETFDVHLCRRLCEGEVLGAEPDTYVLIEHSTGICRSSAFQGRNSHARA